MIISHSQWFILVSRPTRQFCLPRPLSLSPEDIPTPISDGQNSKVTFFVSWSVSR